jgi:hypothetical protein
VRGIDREKRMNKIFARISWETEDMKTCPTCRGTGRVDDFGAEAPCPTCSFEDEICGSGQLHDDGSPVTFDELSKTQLYEIGLE